jgi:hypothetical protein
MNVAFDHFFNEFLFFELMINFYVKFIVDYSVYQLSFSFYQRIGM